MNNAPTDLRSLLAALKQKKPLVNITGRQGSTAALLAARILEQSGRPVICLTAGEQQARELADDIGFFTAGQILYFPGYEIPPYTPLSPDTTTVNARLAVLYEAYTADRPYILVASVEACLRRLLPKSVLSSRAELVIQGEEIDPDELTRRLAASGYESVSLVQSAGDFCKRGGIIDVFPPGQVNPLRLDFFGDTLESLRSFDPVSQRSIMVLDEAILLPAGNAIFPEMGTPAFEQLVARFQAAGESGHWMAAKRDHIMSRVAQAKPFAGIDFFLPLLYEQPCSVLTDYLAPDSRILLVDPHGINQASELVWERIKVNYQEALSLAAPALAPDQLFLSTQLLATEFDRFSRINLLDFPDQDMSPDSCFTLSTGNHTLLQQEIRFNRKKDGLLLPMAERVRRWLDQGDLAAIACRSDRRARQLGEMLGHYRLPVALNNGPFAMDITATGQTEAMLELFNQPISAGFDLDLLPTPGRTLHLLSETELFGDQRIAPRRLRGREKPATLESQAGFDELENGDIVVHKEHGLGIYAGIFTLEHQGITSDFLEIHYQDNDKLYVPVDRINQVSKYKGISDKAPKLDKLGGHSWIKATTKVKEAVWKVAQDLLKLYARRQLEKGHAFSPPDQLYHDLEETFPFEETPGQQRAIEEVLENLTSDQTMDRLICGDVGYGKTEVAIRAAFKVVEDGCQVAVLVPTTVLAEQHGQTFSDRLRDLPVTVACLSRFRTKAEQQRLISGLANGKIDIVIGTHRLLSKDVRFKNLGLLVIDEEHRFGVSHKEKIKRLRANIDVLTLTATPIPRTLQLSLLGIRDLSVINTPPEQRRKILTFVARYDDLVIKEAVVRELQRGGQVYLVHNRVQNIHELALRVEKLVPAARVAFAHGQMPGKQLEEIMVRFVNKELDVLVCTTIIESGLDIPNANTIIINRADRLGLAEIYQLRGRVGRSSEQAYAYLLVPSLDSLTKEARERLRSIMDCSELGGGFKLAMSDLQIRGGGNILGISQSGHIAAVGYDLYLELLQKTVSDLKQNADQDTAVPEIEPEINLQISAYLPKNFIPENDQRYVAYRKIAGLTSAAELQDLRAELRDRYGILPAETENLLEIMELKFLLRKLQITRLEQGRDSLIFAFGEQTPVEPATILAMITRSKNTRRFTPDARLVVPLPADARSQAAAILQTAAAVLAELEPGMSGGVHPAV